MTSEKQNPGYIASKPFTPTLSAAFHRTNKPPLTPKLATPSPGGYRTPRRLGPSEHPSSTATTPSKDDYHQSPAHLLGTNVTPRSNSRTSRRDVVNGSPTSTPSGPLSAPQTPYSQPAMAPGSQNGGAYRSERSPVRAGTKLEPPRPNRARTLTAESQHALRPVSSPEGSAGARRFFHASDARSSNSPDPEPRTKPVGKSSSPASSFFYANGREERPPGEDAIKRRSTGVTRSVVSSKPAPPSASASPSPRFKLSQGVNEPGRLSDSLDQPVPSDETREPPSHRLSAPSSNFPERPPPIPLRRHIKASSVDSGSSAISPREALRPSPIIVSPSDPQIPQIDTNAAAAAAAAPPADPIPGILPRIFSNMSNGSGDTHASASPIKSDTPSQATNDPAASARVGRKIMDLEISNSSLLAINRTLEREMRKQNGELRRFRRLSRAGHFSAAPTGSASGPTLDTTHETEEGSSEISTTQSPDELSDISDEEDDEDSTDEGVMSPGSLAEHDAKHRVSDEKHVFTDLAKHQELLVDSQKMNQSLRRCLGWTEELIREGQKALEYNVHVNDVELGGRVLAPEELLDIGESARGLLSSSAASDYKSDLSSTSSYDLEDSASASTATDTA